MHFTGLLTGLLTTYKRLQISLKWVKICPTPSDMEEVNAQLSTLQCVDTGSFAGARRSSLNFSLSSFPSPSVSPLSID
jgi:hypothetical protein